MTLIITWIYCLAINFDFSAVQFHRKTDRFNAQCFHRISDRFNAQCFREFFWEENYHISGCLFLSCFLTRRVFTRFFPFLFICLFLFAELLVYFCLLSTYVEHLFKSLYTWNTCDLLMLWVDFSKKKKLSEQKFIIMPKIIYFGEFLNNSNSVTNRSV